MRASQKEQIKIQQENNAAEKAAKYIHMHYSSAWISETGNRHKSSGYTEYSDSQIPSDLGYEYVETIARPLKSI